MERQKVLERLHTLPLQERQEIHDLLQEMLRTGSEGPTSVVTFAEGPEPIVFSLLHDPTGNVVCMSTLGERWPVLPGEII